MYSEVVHPENNLRQNNHPSTPNSHSSSFLPRNVVPAHPPGVVPSTPFQVVTDQPFFSPKTLFPCGCDGLYRADGTSSSSIHYRAQNRYRFVVRRRSKRSNIPEKLITVSFRRASPRIFIRLSAIEAAPIPLRERRLEGGTSGVLER